MNEYKLFKYIYEELNLSKKYCLKKKILRKTKV
jgi:hypothetical protein